MATHKFDTDIIIAGAGLVGLTLALSLSGTKKRPTGLSLTIIDPSNPSAAHNDNRAFSLSLSSKNMLDALGLWDDLEDHAQPVTEIDITDSKLAEDIRPILLHFDNQTEQGEPAAYIIESQILRTALYQAAKKIDAISFITPAKITKFDTYDDSIIVTLDNNKTLCGKFLAACDGRNSTLRKKAGIKTVEWKNKQMGIVATLKHTLPHHGHAVQHFLPAGPFAMLPLTGNRTSLVWTESKTFARKAMLFDEERFLQEVDKRASIGLGSLSLENQPNFFPLAMNVARDYIKERFVLVGDSAHGMHWIAGQGLNFGLRDVAALAELTIKAHRLGLDIGSVTVLKDYERWRRFDSFTFTASMAVLNSLFSHDNFATRALRNTGLKAADNIPSLKQFLIKEASGLSGDLPRLLKGERL